MSHIVNLNDTITSRADRVLKTYMQSFNGNEVPCKSQISVVKNEVFKSSKIILCHIRGSNQNNSHFECLGTSVVDKEYEPVQSVLFDIKSISKQSVQSLPKNAREEFNSCIITEEMCTSHNNASNSKLNFTANPVVHDDVEGNLTANVEQKPIKVNVKKNKVGDIVSTSRSGHLIQRKNDNNEPVKSENLEVEEGCDTNDNFIDSDNGSIKSIDLNDNADKNKILQDEKISLNNYDENKKFLSETPCGIGLLERLIRSHPVWFLPGIQRAGAVHLLQGKEEGNFIVRQSSQPGTMAVSVRLPIGKGPYIEHYLIQTVNGQLSLESSENVFESIPSLITHYCQCCDELPVQLSLPKTIRDAKNRQQLSSLALLGQEFWRYPMANPRFPDSQNSSPNNNKTDNDWSCDEDFRKKGHKGNQAIVLDLVPLNQEAHIPSLMSSFKNSSHESSNFSVIHEPKPKRPQSLDLLSSNSDNICFASENKTPPQPPPRWTKPVHTFLGKQSPNTVTFTPTKTDSPTFAVEEYTSSEKKFNSSFITTMLDCDHNLSSPQSDQTNMKSFEFEKEKNSLKHFQKEKSHLISPVSDKTGFASNNFEKVELNPTFGFTRGKNNESFSKKHRKEVKPKESAHYQECDILESPNLYYYKSNVADKQSDYEDIWVTDSFSTFKPRLPLNNESDILKQDSESSEELKKRPDILEKLENNFKISVVEKKERESVKEFVKQKTGYKKEEEEKQSSPFYAEPADALVIRRKCRHSLNKSRHSDPFSPNNWSPHLNPYFSGGNLLDRIDSQNEINEELTWKGKPSLSFDNIVNLKKQEGDTKSKVTTKPKNIVKGKPVRPPKVYGNPVERTRQNWAVDSSWEFIGNEDTEKEGENRFPSIEQQMDSDEACYKNTVQEMIAKRFPQFKISRIFMDKNTDFREHSSLSREPSFEKGSFTKTCSRISAYDNLSSDRPNCSKGCSVNDTNKSCEENCDNGLCAVINHDQKKINEGEIDVVSNQYFVDSLRNKRRNECGSVSEDNEDAQTIFSEPWDSSRWENLLLRNFDSTEPVLKSNDSEVAPHLDSGSRSVETSDNLENPIQKIFRKESWNSPFNLPQHILKTKELTVTGASIRSYALHLASDKSTTFAQNIDNFIECTLESKETSPQIIMRNMRQFMSGMKNYLVKHGEREFEKQVERERMKLKSTEFLNLDAILEGVMHKLVVRPLREHLYKSFVDEYIKNGAIQLLYENLNYAKTKELYELGLKTKIEPPSRDALHIICYFISKLQEVDSPLEKLDHLLACVSTIIYSVKHNNRGKPGITLGADDILPLFVWVLVQSGFIAAEIEAEYMWGLLQPSLLSGEGCYYLTTLSSAVHVLKNLKLCDLDQSNKMPLNEWRCGDLKYVLKIIVPDELHGSILTKTLPVKPNMTTKDVCKIIAHKIRITNPQDYGLFRLVDGEETLLNDSECPQDVKCQLLDSGKHCTLAYKRIDAKIGWPRTTLN